MKWTEADRQPRLSKQRGHPRSRAPGSGPGSYLMTDGEWENFWATRDSDFLTTATLVGEERSDSDDEAVVVSLLASGCGFKLAVSSISKPAYGSRGRGSRTTRCGSCVACHAQDCGHCKNCKDKPRFGGPGIKKKACLARICRNATPARNQNHARDDDADDMACDEEENAMADKEENAATNASSTLTVDVASAEEAAGPFLAAIVEACKRQPLTPIRSRSCSQLDMLSTTALQTVPC